MKLGFVSAILDGWSFEEMIDTARDLGFSCVEAACWPSGKAERRYAGVSHIDVDGLTDEKSAYILGYCKERGVELSSLAFYPNTMDEKLGEPVRTYMGGLLEDLRSYAEEFDHNSESLMLFGNAGLGKTHAALAIAGIVLEKDFDVIYVSSPDFFSKLEALHFGADPGGEEETLLQTAAGADLLILDDLGTEFNSNFFLSTLYSLLNNRLGAHLPTIVTTNITDGALLEKLYTEKISSRLSAFVPCLFAGQDIRSQKAQEV